MHHIYSPISTNSSKTFADLYKNKSKVSDFSSSTNLVVEMVVVVVHTVVEVDILIILCDQLLE